MSIEAVMPAAVAVAVSLGGFLYARLMTSRYDRQKSDRERSAAEPVVSVDLADLEQALSSEGINPGRLAEVLRDAKHRTIEVPVSASPH